MKRLPKGEYRPVAWLKLTPRDLTLSRGIQFEYNEDGLGLGDSEEVLLETASGIPFALVRYAQAPAKKYTAIFADVRSGDCTGVVDDIMIAFELQSSDFLLFDLNLYRFAPCFLTREDDHGNQFTIAEFNCYPDAFYRMRELERAGHKQTYAVKRKDAPYKGWTGTWSATSKSEIAGL